MSFIKSNKISPTSYLKNARMYAKQHGYNPSLLTFSDNMEKKLNYDGVDFGSSTNNDYIIYKTLEEENKVEKGKSEMMRKNYLKRSTNIKGDWKKNPKSRNMLAIKILWNGKI